MMFTNVDTASDWMLLLCILPLTYFAVRFSTGWPRSWFKDPLGWVIFLFNISILALLGLIVYGIVFGQAISEPYRLTVSTAVFLSACAKAFMLERERYRGRLTLPVYQHSSRYTGPNPTIKGDHHDR